jgi:hypothetical protein
MPLARREAAINALKTLSIGGRNRVLADYWLSLWAEDKPPVRAAFNPARIRTLLPGIGLFSVKPGVSAACRLAGTAIGQSLGRDLTSLDWRAYTPKEQWAERLARNSAIAEGQIGIGVRSRDNAQGERRVSVELQLPFADEMEDGARQILFHLDWRAPDFAPMEPGDSSVEVQVADAFHAIALF